MGTDTQDDHGDAFVRDLTHAWLRLQGYTAQQITDGETDTHQRAGCQYENHNWDCDDEYGRPRHPEKDAVDQAAEMAHFVAEWLDGRTNA